MRLKSRLIHQSTNPHIKMPPVRLHGAFPCRIVIRHPPVGRDRSVIHQSAHPKIKKSAHQIIHQSKNQPALRLNKEPIPKRIPAQTTNIPLPHNSFGIKAMTRIPALI